MKNRMMFTGMIFLLVFVLATGCLSGDDMGNESDDFGELIEGSYYESYDNVTIHVKNNSVNNVYVKTDVVAGENKTIYAKKDD